MGNDAKEHFTRARAAGKRDSYIINRSEEQTDITYIEGVDRLRVGIEALVSSIYRKDAANVLGSVLPLAAIDSRGLLRAFEDSMGKTSTAALTAA